MTRLWTPARHPVAVVHQAVVTNLMGIRIRQRPCRPVGKALVSFQQNPLVMRTGAADDPLDDAGGALSQWVESLRAGARRNYRPRGAVVVIQVRIADDLVQVLPEDEVGADHEIGAHLALDPDAGVLG